MIGPFVLGLAVGGVQHFRGGKARKRALTHAAYAVAAGFAAEYVMDLRHQVWLAEERARQAAAARPQPVPPPLPYPIPMPQPQPWPATFNNPFG